MLTAMRPGYLVDGYNVIHREPVLKLLLDADAESAREKLIGLLADFRAQRRVRMTVVFDGRAGTGLDAHTRALGVEVVYARYPESADDRIVALVGRSRHPRSLTVVSSDRGLVARCRDHGAHSLGAEEFLARAREARSGQAPGRTSEPGEKPEMKPGDSAEWAEYFRKGGVDVDSGDGVW
ncbi:MAG TPA: hypothetical protein ENN51_08145 [candidate division WOR-3 bacterium]|uniref:NYN domain-containing protein n=1 Tax=candidate division WOR-3 bacterium TaxID=2052148 RepID=A0A7V0T775_UNCW3|nr:hypothetical protein [candidate division WOR-3 bacterium]